jgi:nucleoside-triphosphatase THEP1
MAYALVIGTKGGSRFEAVGAIADALAARGVRVGGFTQRTVRPGSGASWIEIARVPGGGARTLARSAAAQGASDDPASCTFAFDPAVLAEARRWVVEDAVAADVVFLDGVGTLELGGGGHREAVAHALRAARVAIVAVRHDQLLYAIEALGAGEPIAAYTAGEGPAALDAFVAEVARAAAGQASGPAVPT